MGRKGNVLTRRWKVVWVHKGQYKSKKFWLHDSAEWFMLTRWDEGAEVFDLKPLEMPR